MFSLIALLLLSSTVVCSRLSRDVIPSRQLLDLKFNFDTWTYSGSTGIDIEVKKDVEEIRLNSAKTVEIVGVKLEDSDTQFVELEEAIVDHSRKVLLVKPTKTIKKGTYKLKIRFTGKVGEALQGMLRTGFVSAEGVKHKQVSTHFEPDKARDAFPCFDEPSLRLKIKLLVEHPASHTCISAAPVLKRTQVDEDTVRTEFEETRPISIYLLAINIHDMDKVTLDSESGIPVTVHSPPSRKKHALVVAKWAADALDFFEEYLDMKYPFKKLDLIGIYDFNAGGMENIGMIHLMYDCAYAEFDTITVNSYLYCRTVVVHEVSHMWFGNLVSLKWWDDLWLKEGFARFFTAFSMDKLKTDRLPEAHMIQVVKRGFLNGVDEDKYRFTKPVRQKLEDSYGAAAMFNSLSYAKSSWILRGILKLIGEPTFQKGIQKYFKTYQFASANFHDFTKCFDNITEDVSVKRFMENWLNEPGLPVIKVSQDGETLNVTQSRYSPSWDYATNQVWIIPLNAKSDSQNATDYKLWDTVNTTLNLTEVPEWHLMDTENAGFVLYYYEEANILKIAEQLRKDPHFLTTIQRKIYVATLIEHYNTNKLSSKMFLETSRYVHKETESSIVTFWVRELLSFKRSLYLAENSYIFEKYLKHLLLPHLTDLMKCEIEDVKTWNKRKYYQYLFYFGIKWRNENARERARRMIRAFSRGKHINATFLAFVLRYHLKVKKDWDWLFNKLDTYPKSLHEYDLILRALAKTNEPKKQLFLLRFSKMSDKMPRAQKRKVVCYIAWRNPRLAWSFFTDNYNFYFNMLGESQFTFDRLLECVTENLETQEDYNEVRNFFDKNPTGTGKSGLKRGLKSISQNVKQQKMQESGSSSRNEDYDAAFEEFLDGISPTELV